VVEGSKDKPRTSSLLAGMTLDTVSLDDALRLLTLPRVVGVDPADGQEITAQNGRYGPYIKKGTDSRSLESEEELFSVTLDDALKLLAEPKRRAGRGQAAPPLRELGDDPASGKPIVLKEGRFGPYVTDGDTNASLRKGDRIEGITSERAAELLADRRAAGPSPKRAGRKATAKKSGARKAGTKKATARNKKATAKRAPTKKRAAPTKAAAKRAAADKSTT
jgi:DNA topoisomerase-1